MEYSAPDDTLVTEHSGFPLVPSLLLGMMRSDTIFLSNGHIDQLIISIWLNKVQAFLDLGVGAMTKTIALLGVSISMMARILAQVIEGLCIL